MKKRQTIALCIVLCFAIDYSLTQLLNFHLLYDRLYDTDIMEKLYAFMIGISAFYSILLLGKKED